MPSFTFFKTFLDAFGKEIHKFDTDTFKIALLGSAPNTTTAVGLTDLTQLTAVNGYTAGGFTLTGSTWTDGAGSKKVFDALNVTVNAVGGSIGPFQHLAIYNDTATNKEVVGLITLDAAVTILDGQSPIIKFDDAGIFDLDVV